MIVVKSMNGLLTKEILNILCYYSTKAWKISINDRVYEKLFNEEIKDLLDSVRDNFLNNKINFLFAIAWNELLNNWNRRIPFLTDPDTKLGILKYMALQHHLDIPGPTKVVFDHMKDPVIVIIFNCGEKFNFKTELSEEGLVIMRVTLSDTLNAFNLLNTFEFDPEKYLDVTENDLNGCYIVDIHNFKTTISEDVKLQLKNLSIAFNEMVNNDLTKCRSWLNNIFKSMGAKNTTEEGLISFYKTISLVHMLLKFKTNANKELVYLFNSSKVHYYDNDLLLPLMKDGGCFVLMGDKGTFDIVGFYLMATISLCKLSSVQKIFRIYFEKIHAIRSAIAAIMSRNGSHNIGSHVIYNVAKDINDLNIQDTRYLLKYIQQRVDFIAQISTAWVPEWTSSSWLIKEVMRGFFEQQHLLNYIAKSEGLQVCHHRLCEDICNNIRYISKCVVTPNKDTGKRDIIIQIDFSESKACKDDENGKANNKLDSDVLVAIPGANIGFHAFYTIIENFLRNAAKHEFAKLPESYKRHEKLKLIIEFQEDQNQSYTVRIWDNLSYITNISVHDENDKDLSNNFLEKEFSINESLYQKLIKDERGKIKVIQIIRKDSKANELIIENHGFDESLFSKYGANNQESLTFIIHPFELIDNFYQPIEINGFDKLINKSNVRFISEPTWKKFQERHQQVTYQNNKDINQKIKKFLNDLLEPVHVMINNKLTKDIIEPDGKLRMEDWGLAEMRICAGYLQKKEISHVGIGKNTFEFFKALPIAETTDPHNPDSNKRAYRLGFEFKINKPKEVLIIGTDGLTNKKKLENQSIYIAESLSLCNDFDFEFIVFMGKAAIELCEELKDENKQYTFLEELPYRIICINDGNFEIPDSAFIKKRIAFTSSDDKQVLKIKELINSETNDLKNKSKQFKLSLYEFWIKHIKENWRGLKDDIYLVVKSTHSGNGSSINNEFESFFKEIEVQRIYDDIDKQYLDISNDRINQCIAKALSNHYGFYNKNYLPRTLPKEIGSDISIPLQFIACRFQNNLEYLDSINTIEAYNHDYHDKTIAYIRHNHLCIESSCIHEHNPVYDEEVGGAALHFPVIANIPSLESKEFNSKKMLLKLIENGLLRIAIADERCWDFLAERPNFAIKLTKCCIYPVQQFLSYKDDNRNFGKEVNVLRIIEDNDEINIMPDNLLPDAIIIHQGILDKLQREGSSSKEIADILTKLKIKIPLVIITSGRGESPHLPNNVKYVNFSFIEQHILSEPHSKLLFTDSLMKLTKRKQ